MLSLAIVSGLGMGGMYGLLALGFYITYAVSNTVNFAQGTSLMLGAVLCYLFSVTLHWPIGLAIVVGARAVRAVGHADRALRRAAVRARRLQRVADVDGGGRHHPRARR